MRSRLLSALLLALSAALVFAWFSLGCGTPVKASSDCPVVSTTPDGKGGTTVVFDCQTYLVTIDEPQWP